MRRRVDPAVRAYVGLDSNKDIVWVKLAGRTTVEWAAPATALQEDYDRWNAVVADMNTRVGGGRVAGGGGGWQGDVCVCGVCMGVCMNACMHA